MYILECWEGFGAGGEWEDEEENALRTLLDLSGRTGLTVQAIAPHPCSPLLFSHTLQSGFVPLGVCSTQLHGLLN